eukprot:TRINITY_DN9372_c0_g1_i5.p2 TRINITY_DN9372_c0_g1~~TRINITY_DN9372_c0_g1_i5.p2  ORF type:complete len:215 (-),score=29.72 TRINITY_DN9372_c0_g1_i5:13-657(-)
MLTACVVGLLGAFRKNISCLNFYVFTVWMLFVVFWILFALFLQKKIDLENQVLNLCNNHVASGLAATLQKAYTNNLPTQFCSEECPCASHSARFPPDSEYTSAVFKPTGAQNIYQCPKDVYGGDRPKKEATGFLAELENRFECSGLCTREKWFYFSDVNRGAPLYSCQETVLKYISEKFIMAYGIILTCAVIMFFAPAPALVFICINSRSILLS